MRYQEHAKFCLHIVLWCPVDNSSWGEVGRFVLHTCFLYGALRRGTAFWGPRLFVVFLLFSIKRGGGVPNVLEMDQNMCTTHKLQTSKLFFLEGFGQNWCRWPPSCMWGPLSEGSVIAPRCDCFLGPAEDQSQPDVANSFLPKPL